MSMEPSISVLAFSLSFLLSLILFLSPTPFSHPCLLSKAIRDLLEKVTALTEGARNEKRRATGLGVAGKKMDGRAFQERLGRLSKPDLHWFHASLPRLGHCGSPVGEPQRPTERRKRDRSCLCQWTTVVLYKAGYRNIMIVCY